MVALDDDVPFLSKEVRQDLDSPVISALLDGPRTPQELDDMGLSRTVEPRHRPYVSLLKVSGSSGRSRIGGTFTYVYHMHGDLRRGIRRFIEENEVELANTLDSRYNIVGESFDEYDYQVLKEEWYRVRGT